MLTPLSLQYHNHNLINQSHTLNNHHHNQLGQQQYHPQLPPHHPLHPNNIGASNGGVHHGNGGQPSYATTHRTFPSAQPADLIFSSLNRKKQHRTTGGHGHHMNTADIIETGSTAGRRGGGPSPWYADLIHGHPQNNGKGRYHNGGTNGSTGGGMMHSNGYISGNGGVPIARPLPPIGAVKMNGDHNILPHHTPKHPDIPLIAPGTGNGTGFPLIRGGEINV